MNPLVTSTDSPPIPAVQGWGRAYDGSKGPLIDLCQAVPGYAPHPELLARLAAAASDPLNAKYGPIAGDTLLREVVAAESDVSVDRVLITAGCNQAFFTAMLAFVPRGAAVLLPTPWYYNHKMTCDMLGLEARALPTSAASGFIPDPELAATLMDGVAAVVLINPNNPTGAIYPHETVEKFAALCRERGAVLLIDETYRDFSAEPANPPTSDAIRLYSFSKSYAVPGHRVGSLTVPTGAVPQILKVLDCLHICPQRPAQTALAWAVDALRGWRHDNCVEMLRRAEGMQHAFGTIPDWHIETIGAYFAYVRHPFTGLSAWTLTEQLAREYGVMLLPAPAFAGSPDHLRVSFANVDLKGIERFAERLATVRVSVR